MVTETALTTKGNASLIEQVVMVGDLSKLPAEQRVVYYREVCQSMGLNPLTRPFEYITLNGKLTLYAKKDCTDQLRKSNKVSITLTDKRVEDGTYIVTAKAQLPDGRTDESTGAVDLSNLKGDARANAMMKAETKAKRRVTLSIVGLGWLDESETETIPGAKVEVVDLGTGEIVKKEKTFEQTFPAHESGPTTIPDLLKRAYDEYGLKPPDVAKEAAVESTAKITDVPRVWKQIVARFPKRQATLT